MKGLDFMTLKEKYLQLIEKEVWQSKSMLDYCNKKISQIVETEKGYLLEIEKPSIETNFCFGYSDSRYDTEDYDRANDMAHHAKTCEQYFIDENLKALTHWIESLNKYEAYLINHYSACPKDTKLKAIRFMSYWDIQNMTEEQKQEYEPMSETDKQTLIKAYEVEIEKFKKRLNTYLKRYGLSKVHSWSYWQDA